VTLQTLEPYRADISGVAVESTFNWYWLVDGLMEAGYPVMLVNTAKARQYEGLKHTDDRYDAFWLAQQMRLGILPTGYIYPKEQRALRDLLRERRRLVRQRTTHVLSTQSTLWRHTAVRLSSKVILGVSKKPWPHLSDANVELGVRAHRATIKVLTTQLEVIERTVLKSLQPRPEYQMLRTVPGIGPVIAWTIVLEAGDVRRFVDVGHFASYCRCVDSQRTSNERKKGEKQCQERQSVSRLGVLRGRAFRYPVSAGCEALLRKEGYATQSDPRHEGTGAQARTRLLLHHAR